MHANLSNTASEYKLKDDQEPGNEGERISRRHGPAHLKGVADVVEVGGKEVYFLECEWIFAAIFPEAAIPELGHLDLYVDQEGGIVDETKGQSQREQNTADRMKFLIVEAGMTDGEEQEHEEHADIGHQECDILFSVGVFVVRIRHSFLKCFFSSHSASLLHPYDTLDV